MSPRPKLMLGGLLLILAVAAAACSDTITPAAPALAPQPAPAPSPTPARWPTTATAPAPSAPLPLAPTEARLEVASDIMNFTLEDLTVEVGTRIAWANRDSASHTSTSGSQGNKTGIWDGPPLAEGTSFAFVFTETGTFPYFCAIHPTSMNATITIVAEGALGASTTPQPPTVEAQH